jgi:hypothetical protein
LGDDACLLEDDNVSKASPAVEDDFRCDHEASNQVDMLIDQMAKGVSDATLPQDDDTQPVLEPMVVRQEVSDASIDRVAASGMPSRDKVVSLSGQRRRRSLARTSSVQRRARLLVAQACRGHGVWSG